MSIICKVNFIYLFLNNLQGPIPPNIWKCTHLECLALSNNNLSGIIPFEIGKMSMLRELYLDENDFQGHIPANIWNCKHLEFLYLNNNNLSGTISHAIGTTSMVRVLKLTYNHFTGHIPPNIWKCKHLEILYLYNNNLSGTISRAIGNTSMLRVLDLSNNYFTGELPQVIGTLPLLEEFTAYNNSLYGSIPSSLFNTSTMNELQILYNEFSGTLPLDMGNSFPNLEWLLLSHNRLSGPIPSSLTNASKLIFMDMSDNSFSGSIPNFGNLKLLQKLFLEENNLSGAEFPTQELTFLSSLTNCRHLKDLEVSDNPLNGILPASIGNFSISLEYFCASNCNIIGAIPLEVGNLSSLLNLYLHDNFLSGVIPPTIGKMKQLQMLYLFDNQLAGSIPNDLCRLYHLGELSLYENMLVGRIPECLGDIKSLREIYLDSNQLNSTIPPSLWIITDLVILSLSSNHLSGKLSSEVGNLKMINSLDLSSNQFSDVIPTSIDEGLPFLENFNVSNNKLEGKIPDGGNFPNFSALSFSHNIALCGPIKFQVAPCSENHRRSWLKKLIVSSVVLVVVAVIVMLILIRKHKQKTVALSADIPPLTTEYGRVSYIELEQGTRSFCETNLLGREALRSFDSEATILSSIRHRNLVRVIGCCSNMEFKALILTYMPNGSLDNNHIVGVIPSEIGNLSSVLFIELGGDIPTSIGGCQSLESLYLSNNLLDGSIPQSLGNVRNLIALDLSYNNLSGSIPKSLEDLHFLEYFNVSNNKLVGEIPERGCFGNLSDQSFSHNLALCVPIRFEVPPCTKNLHRSRSLMNFILPSVILAVTMVIVILVFIKICKPKKSPVHPTDISPVTEYRRVSYIELEQGTSGFSESNLLGRGSFGSVIEATLSDGLKTAVKVFNLQLQGAERSFDTETEILGSIRHRNIVRVIGCCSSPEFKALVLTYMPKGSLDKWLYSNIHCLDLIQRLKIGIDVATVLEYLHYGHTFPVVHRDGKPKNVLLDQDMVAHLGDFGIGKLFDDEEVVAQTQTLATIGYAAPELGMEGKVSTQGDVYSFGIMLLEMFTGKKPTDDMFDGEMRLKEWVSESLQGNSVPIAHALLSGEDQDFCAKEQCVLSIFVVAMACLVDVPHERINMIEATTTLQRIYATMQPVSPMLQCYLVIEAHGGLNQQCSSVWIS
ncbi:receptor kinase-like protein Xa21 [Salvia hispanica]|uniref:receptor kinase-like protein Xa21 n=1 Tax=Salvia hispanica TaxID=49212 RepID=UPI00200979D2|nr:receptor kinase-like protein Xa21 [Salvia hispanica]